MPGVLSRPVHTFRNELRECCSSILNDYRKDMEGRRLVPTTARYLRAPVATYRAVGAERMQRIILLCNTIPGYHLSNFQRLCLKSMLICIAPAVFHDCASDEQPNFFRKMGWEPMPQWMVFLQTSRRAGKTQIMTILAAALLLVVPELDILAWSLRNETSKGFGKTVKTWLEKMGALDEGVTIWCNDVRVELVFPNGERRELSLLGAQNAHVSLFVRVLCSCPAGRQTGLFEPPFLRNFTSCTECAASST